jgi:dihydropteroate synthase
MEYQAAANVLFDLGRFPPGTGLEPTRELLGHLGDPHEGLTVVQVAGSNGKGSTSRMVERVLREAGLDVGLYTSPHLDDVRERVQVNGRPVTKARVAEFVELCRGYLDRRAAANDSPTFFEALTALALWEFDSQAVDVVVLEVGIGGRFDATSVCDPIASAVTSVTLEHADLLGDTVAEIAGDKAHVAPADAPLVTATTGEALDAVRATAGDVVRIGSDDEADVVAEYGGRDGLEGIVDLAGRDRAVGTRLPLIGAHQAANAGVAAALCRQVGATTGVEVTETHLARGLRNAHWPGRFEVMERDPLVVLDSAHNPGSAERVTETLDAFDYDALSLVVGAMADKDHAGMAEAFPRADRVYTCRPGMERAETAEALAVSFADHVDSAAVMDDVGGAVDPSLLRSWAPWIVLGVILGSMVARFAPQGVMLLVFATVALIVAGYMALAPEGMRLADDLPRGPVRWLIASLIGGVSSIMGIGGGTLSVPTLTLCSYPVRRAVGTGAAIGLLIAVPATVGMMVAGWDRVGLPVGSIGFVNVLGFAVLVPMTALMAPVGVRLAHRIPPRWLRRAFAAFLLLTALRMYADWFALA